MAFIEKKIKNVNKIWVALLSTETRKSQPCPLRIGWVLAKLYGDLFYTTKSVTQFLLLAKFSSDSKAIRKFSSDSKAISKIFF